MARKKPIPKEISYKIDFHTPEFFESRVATNITIQNYNENYKLSFYELKPDMVFSDEDRKRMEKRGTLRADCVGSFIITPTDIKKFADLMYEQIEKREKAIQDMKE